MQADEELAAEIAVLLRADIEARGRAALVLPGGSSPKALIKALARRHDVPWDLVSVTTTDERCVPLEDEGSNAGQVRRLCAAENLEITPTALWDDAQRTPIFDITPWPPTVTVLGMGTDGHIASLFPGQDWEAEDGEMLLRATAPFAPHARVSFSLSALLASKTLILLVKGAEKQAVYDNCLSGEAADLPLAALIEKAGGKLDVRISD